MSSSTTCYNHDSISSFTLKSRAPIRSSSTSSTSSQTSKPTYQLTPKSHTLTLTRSLSASSTSSNFSTSSSSQPSSAFLEHLSQCESRHPSEIIYRRMPDSPKPHYFYERPGFFIPKRSAPKAPGSPSSKTKVLSIGVVDREFGEEEE